MTISEETNHATVQSADQTMNRENSLLGFWSLFVTQF